MTENNKKIETHRANRTRDFYVFTGGFVKTTTMIVILIKILSRNWQNAHVVLQFFLNTRVFGVL